jgi:hypothetical protein
MPPFHHEAAVLEQVVADPRAARPVHHGALLLGPDVEILEARQPGGHRQGQLRPRPQADVLRDRLDHLDARLGLHLDGVAEAGREDLHPLRLLPFHQEPRRRLHPQDEPRGVDRYPHAAEAAPLLPR